MGMVTRPTWIGAGCDSAPQTEAGVPGQPHMMGLLAVLEAEVGDSMTTTPLEAMEGLMEAGATASGPAEVAEEGRREVHGPSASLPVRSMPEEAAQEEPHPVPGVEAQAEVAEAVETTAGAAMEPQIPEEVEAADITPTVLVQVQAVQE